MQQQQHSSDECKTNKMPESHALLIPLPAQGHINPMMHLASKLVSDGFLVSFVTTELGHTRIIQAKSKDLQDNNDMIRMVTVPDRLSPEQYRGDFGMFFRAVEEGLGPSVIDRLIRDINSKEDEPNVSCIIADVGTCFGLHAVAKLHHISLAGFHTSLVSTCAIRYFSAKLVSLGILPSDGIPKEDTKETYLPSMPPLRSTHLPWLYGGEFMFRHGIRMAQEISKIEWILFNTFYELEPEVADELSKELGTYLIGPLGASEFLDLDSRETTVVVGDDVECLQWLQKQPEQSVIYVSFGSIAVLNKKQVEELALALEDIQRPFLWVVRSDLMDGSDAVLPPGFLERNRDRGCIVSWAPQLRVLSHPSIACFVTHCGWNSVQESITMGVPMLCWPYFADQFINSTYIVDVWKVGLPLNANQEGIIEKGEFTKAIEMLLAGEEGVQIREAVSKLKTSARNAVKEGGSSSNNYNIFLNAVTKPTSQ